MLHHGAALVALAGFACISGCDGPPSRDVGIDFFLYNRTFDRAPLRAHPGHGVTVAEAWVAVADVLLTDCRAGNSSRFEGPFVVDMLSSAPVDGLDDLPLSADRFCRFGLGWDALTDRAPGAAEGRALLVSGLFAYPDTTIVSFFARLTPPGPVVLAPTSQDFDAGTGSLLVGIDAGILFGDVDFEAAVVTDGQILIDDANNTAFYEALQEELPRALALFSDTDGDGQLGVDERERPIAKAPGT